jgi:hypothetical protein
MVAAMKVTFDLGLLCSVVMRARPSNEMEGCD